MTQSLEKKNEYSFNIYSKIWLIFENLFIFLPCVMKIYSAREDLGRESPREVEVCGMYEVKIE